MNKIINPKRYGIWAYIINASVSLYLREIFKEVPAFRKRNEKNRIKIKITPATKR